VHVENVFFFKFVMLLQVSLLHCRVWPAFCWLWWNFGAGCYSLRCCGLVFFVLDFLRRSWM